MANVDVDPTRNDSNIPYALLHLKGAMPPHSQLEVKKLKYEHKQ